MALEDSILKSTKKLLGLEASYTAFDPDIMTHINATFGVLSQIGIGPELGSLIEDDNAKWSDLDIPQDQLNIIKSYMFLQVKTLFDPPYSSFLSDAINKQLYEYTVRLSYLRECALASGG